MLPLQEGLQEAGMDGQGVPEGARAMSERAKTVIGTALAWAVWLAWMWYAIKFGGRR